MLKLRINTPSCIKQGNKIMLKLCMKTPSYIGQNYKVVLELYIYKYFQLHWKGL